jgi:hypothetical protein
MLACLLSFRMTPIPPIPILHRSSVPPNLLHFTSKPEWNRVNLIFGKNIPVLNHSRHMNEKQIWHFAPSENMRDWNHSVNGIRTNFMRKTNKILTIIEKRSIIRSYGGSHSKGMNCLNWAIVDHRQAYRETPLSISDIERREIRRRFNAESSPLFFFHHLNLSVSSNGTDKRGFSSFLGLHRLIGYSQESQKNGPSCDPVGPCEDSIPTWQVPCGILCAFVAVLMMSRRGDRAGVELAAFLLIMIAGFLILTGYIDGEPNNDRDRNQILPQEQSLQHNANNCTTIILDRI